MIHFSAPTRTPTCSPELWVTSTEAYGPPPPSYDDSIEDLPPDYTATDALAVAHAPQYTFFPTLIASPRSCPGTSPSMDPTSSLYTDEKPSYIDIDFGFTNDGVKSHAKKKNNKGGAKKAAPVEEKKEEPPADAGAGDGKGDPPADGGAGGGGSGGDGGDEKKDDDGWGDDAWGTAGSKKKKGKKTKKEEEEEEAEKKRKEEEEEAERKRKEEEAAAAAATAGGDLSWADNTNNDDDWGTFTAAGSKKKKGGKKGKVRNLGCLITRCNALSPHRMPNPQLRLQQTRRRHSTTSILTIPVVHLKLTCILVTLAAGNQMVSGSEV